MNFGLYSAFTRRLGIPAGESYPQLEILFFDGTTLDINADHINKVITTRSSSPVTINVGEIAVNGAQSFHVKQKGAGQVTFVSKPGVNIEVASTVKKTRAQYSMVTVMVEGNQQGVGQVFSLIGDFAAS